MAFLNQLFHFWISLTGEFALPVAIVAYGLIALGIGLGTGLAIGLDLLRANLKKAGLPAPEMRRKK